MSYEHLDNVADVLTEGQEVKVKVLSIDRDAERISLSIKDTLPGRGLDIRRKSFKRIST